VRSVEDQVQPLGHEPALTMILVNEHHLTCGDLPILYSSSLNRANSPVPAVP